MFKALDKISEILGWLQIVISPFLFGIAIGAFIYFQNQSLTTLIIGISISLVGLIVGILYANKIYKTKGTLWFVSRVSASPELDNLEKINKKSDKSGSH